MKPGGAPGVRRSAAQPRAGRWKRTGRGKRASVGPGRGQAAGRKAASRCSAVMKPFSSTISVTLRPLRSASRATAVAFW